EVGRLTDTGLPADVGHGRAVRALLRDQRLLGLRKPRCLHGSPLLPAGKSALKTPTKSGPVWRPQITPTYGYRRIAALLKRERRSAGLPHVNVKHVYRLMKQLGLLLARHTGRRHAREHDGQVAALHRTFTGAPMVLAFR
ncbi:hypothetical protein GW17_00062021, partial [Ensete ventricosum]